MVFFIAVAVVLIGYLLGSIPFGWVVVKVATGRDIRGIESGRTGGTNAWRAAGVLAGFLTALLDMLKGVAAVLIARWLMPPDFPYRTWLEVAAPLAAILGHNYSIYLLETHEKTGKLVLRGGAGGAPCFGGAVGLWLPAFWIILPLAAIVYFVIGYASLTTMSLAFFATVIFLIKAIQGELPWIYVMYGVIAEIMLIWALRPNIKRLREGTERLHGLRPWLKKRAEQQRG